MLVVRPRPMPLVRIARLVRAVIGVAAFVALDSCGTSAPTVPSPTAAVLNGRWVGTLSNPTGGPTCLGDWSRFVLTLQPSGDALTTNDGQQFGIIDSVTGGLRNLNIVIPAPSSVCGSVTLTVASIQVDSAGRVSGFSGSVTGRCCNTIVNTFTFTRG